MRARLLALLALALGAAGCFDPIVGARCADGYVPCHGRCVAVCSTDGGAHGDGPDGQTGDGGSGSGDGSMTGGDASAMPDGGDGGGGTDGANGDAVSSADGAGGAGGNPSGDAGATGGMRGATGGIGGSTGGMGGSTGGMGGSTGGMGGATGGMSGSTGGMGGATGGTAGDAGASPDAGVATDAAASSDAAIGDANPSDASTTDASSADASMNDAAAPADTLAPDAGPPPDMAPPINCGMLTFCPGVGCVNLTNDPDNCGMCGYSCGTGLCVASTCQLRQAGHLVVIGHDYAVSRPQMDNLVGNAVFLAPGTSVKVLAYQGAASAEEINGTNAAINRVAQSTGRTWVRTVVPASDVKTSLPFADVFLIYAQSGATDANLLSLGTDWATELSDFVQAGKTIVVLEGFYPNAGTYQIVQQANLFHATGRTEVTGQTMVVTRAGDAVATRVPQSYRGERSTVWFSTMDQTVVVQVMTNAGTQPVVIHLVF